MTGLPSTKPAVGLPPPSFHGGRIVVALMLREAGTTYGRSPGGYFWAVISPLAAILILTLAFSMVFRTPALGTTFILFYATGFLPFGLYNDVSTKVAASLTFSRSLLVYRGVSWLHAIIARFILNGVTQLTVFCIVIIGILSLVETRTIIDLPMVLLGLAMAGIIGLSVGMMNCFLISLFPVWKRVWAIVTRPLFLASGIFFLYDEMPQIAQDILWFNPLVHAIGAMRAGFYPTYYPDYISGIYVFGLSMTAIALSMILLRRYYRRALEK